MSAILTILTNILVLGSLLALLYHAVALVAEGNGSLWIGLRVIAMCTGLLLFLGARALGLDVQALLGQALAETSPIFALLRIAAPALAGLLTGHFLVRKLTGVAASEQLVQLVIMLTTFFLVVFGDVYATAEGGLFNKNALPHLLPNIAFVLGIGFYLFFKADDIKAARGSSKQKSNWTNGI